MKLQLWYMSKNGVCPDQAVLEDQRSLVMVMACVMVKGQEEVMASAVATEVTKGNSVWSVPMDTSTRKEMILTPFVQVSSHFIVYGISYFLTRTRRYT